MAGDRPVLINLETSLEIDAFGVPDDVLTVREARWSHQAAEDEAPRHTEFLSSPGALLDVVLPLESRQGADRDLRPVVDSILATSQPGELGYPPPCLFAWGSFEAKVVVERVEVHLTRFERGNPVGGTVRLVLNELRDPEKLKQVASRGMAGPSGLGATLDAGLARVRRRAEVEAQATVEAGRRAAAEVGRQAREEAERLAEDVEHEARRAFESLATLPAELADDVLAQVRETLASVGAQAQDLRTQVDTALEGVRTGADTLRSNLEQTLSRSRELQESLRRELEDAAQELAAARDRLAIARRTG